MKTLYIECNMGAAGDMLMSALLELHPDAENFMERMNRLEIPHVRFESERSVKCGITGTHISVTVDGHEEREHHHEHHSHSALHDIEHIISHLDISENVRKNAKSVYRIIAGAEGHVHNCDMHDIHFHEVGTMDAVADVVGVCMLMDELSPDKIVVSPVHVGSGTVRCAHGVLPVPAPATAYILQGIPIYSGSVRGELCTPTGAALLKYFADEFGSMPVMRMEKIGYGMGSCDFEAANCVRAMIGTTDSGVEEIIELRCNIDDMTGEDIAFAADRIFEAGAVDVFTIPVGMKKNRPGIMLACMCGGEDRKGVLHAIFRYTSTIGVREYIGRRYVLDREKTELNTSYGKINAKKSYGYGVTKIKPEHDELERIALENDVAIRDIKIE